MKKFKSMRYLFVLSILVAMLLSPVKSFSQTPGEAIAEGFLDYLLFGSSNEDADLSKYQYDYVTNGKLGHFYISENSAEAKTFDTLGDSMGKVQVHFCACSGMVSNGERLRFMITCEDMNSKYGEYLKSLDSRGSKVDDLRIEITLGSDKPVEYNKLVFSGRLTAYCQDKYMLVDAWLINADLPGTLSQKVEKVRNMVCTYNIEEMSFDGVSYSFANYSGGSSDFYKELFADMDKKIGVSNNDEDYTSMSDSISVSVVFPQSGTQNYIPTAEDSYLSYIRENIKKYDKCRTGAITKSGSGVAIWDGNGYSCYECHKDLGEALENCNNNGYTINDVAISESGYFILVYENNGYSYNGIPDEMATWIKKYNKESKHITSVAFTDEGHWAIVTENNYISDDYTGKVMDEAKAKYGYINSVSLSGNSVVVCCDGGVYYKNAPKKLIERLNKVDFLPKVIKFTDNGLLLITDGDKKYDYFM